MARSVFRRIADARVLDVSGGVFERTCERARALGFEAILVTGPSLAAASDAASPSVSAQCRVARAFGLATLVQIDLRDARGAASPGTVDALTPRLDRVPASPAATLDAWHEHVAAVIDAGAAGILAAALSASAATWRPLLRRLRTSRPDAWIGIDTLGASPAVLDAMAPFVADAALSSMAWWDGQGNWYYDERRRLANVAARVIGVLDTGDAGDEARGAASRRAAFAHLWPWLADGVLARLDAPTGSAGNEDASAVGSRFAKSDAAGPGAPRNIRPLLRGQPGIVALAFENDAGQGAVVANLAGDALLTVSLVDLMAEAGYPLRIDTPSLTLAPGEVHEWRGAEAPARVRAAPPAPVRAAVESARIAIEAVSPVLDGGRFAVKRCVGDRVIVAADVFADGHGRLGAAVAWKRADEREWQRTPMRLVDNDRWEAQFGVDAIARFEFKIEAWCDDFATLREEIDKKRRADVLSDLDLADARRWLADVAARHPSQQQLADVIAQFDAGRDRAARADVVLGAAAASALAQTPELPFVAASAAYPIEVERLAARYAAWYELFPRSWGGAGRHGTFDDVIAQLREIRDMGFDVVYMPPIHPIGTAHRKGRNNALQAEGDDPGSPYAIGAADGGHDAVHAELGGLPAFRRLVGAAAELGLEIALDFAVQASPDHPWLRSHGEWFARRADGTIRYAENPPKKYEDIVNVDFFGEGALPSLWLALRDVVLFWIDEGVRTFRVDNPHTKPLPFWEWLIADVRSRCPEAIFLSEAFTRPKPMYRLAKLGFSQSYTYFIWRNAKRELEAYVRELNGGDPRECFRPHFFVNTPDINPYVLQQGGRSAHLIRAALAATLSGLWGVYSGFEVCEAAALPGREEYLDSEKYQLRTWDRQRPGNIVAEIARLNFLRRTHPELQTHLGVEFLDADDEQVLFFAKRAAGATSAVLVAISLDPYAAHTATLDVPLWQFGLPDTGRLDVEDLWLGTRFVWQGRRHVVTLAPDRPLAIWRVRVSSATALGAGH